MTNRFLMIALSLMFIANSLFAGEYFISSIEDSIEIQDDKPENKIDLTNQIVSDTVNLTPFPDSVFIASESSLSSSDKNDTIKKPWPTGALLRSALIPGWGQFYNKQYIKTVIYGGLEVFLAYKARKLWQQMDKHQWNLQNSDDPVYQEQEFKLYENKRDDRNLHLWFAGLTIFISMFDAYVDAHMADFDQPDKVFEVHLEPETDRIKVLLSINF